MTGLNSEWALSELDKFVAMTVTHHTDTPGVIGVFHTAATTEEITQQLQVIEMIVRRVLPIDALANLTLIASKTGEWKQVRPLALRAKALLERQTEIDENLGDGAPAISASALHPWIWSGAASLWQSRHYRSAVEDAAKKLNAETQNKVGRRDLSETKLFQEAFSTDAPTGSKMRLRRMKDDGSDTYKSMQRGAMALAEGIYAGIRNPFNHEDPKDIDEQTGLEYLAALSVLARWVDDADVEKAS